MNKKPNISKANWANETTKTTPIPALIATNKRKMIIGYPIFCPKLKSQIQKIISEKA